MARVDVIMPQMGESIAEGTLSKWLKKVGDAVKRDEPIFEISTDKVDAEIPAPSAGVLAEIKVQEGQTVPIQTVVAVLETEAGAAAAAPRAAPAPAPAKAVTPASPTPAPLDAAPRAAPAPAPAVRPQPPTPVSLETAEERLRRRSTPLVRKIAAEHKVDIGAVPGSGFAGRVTKKDILGYIETGGTEAQAHGGTEVSRASAAPAPVPPLPAASSAWEATPWPGDRVETMSRIRQLTADHMVFSRRTRPTSPPSTRWT